MEPGIAEAALKSAYRRMSLLYHPDKNPDNAEAAAMFIEVARAYKTLTDPVAKENFEKYGNPDGRQSLAVSMSMAVPLRSRNLNIHSLTVGYPQGSIPVP